MSLGKIPLQRQRKTKAPCEGCGLHLDRCLCSEIPRLDLKTSVCLVIHSRELKRTTNTGQLALRALVNSEMRVRGEGREALDLSDLLTPDFRTLLFYPSEDAVELDPEFLQADERPIRLIVPDGNWRQASKVHSRQPELAKVPRVKIGALNKDPFRMRAEPKPEGMATLQAIAKALGVIEGAEVENTLMRLYDLKLRRTLQGRGVFDLEAK